MSNDAETDARENEAVNGDSHGEEEVVTADSRRVVSALTEDVEAPVNEGTAPLAELASTGASNEAEIDTRENEVVNDDIHDEEATIDTRHVVSTPTEQVEAPVSEGTAPRAELSSTNASNEAEIDARENEVVNDDIHDGEATTATCRIQRPLNLPSTASAKSTGDPNPGHSQVVSKASKGNRNDKWKTILGTTGSILGVVEKAAEGVPIPGLAPAVSIVRGFAEKLHVSASQPWFNIRR
jgi:hypothetical protein